MIIDKEKTITKSPSKKFSLNITQQQAMKSSVTVGTVQVEEPPPYAQNVTAGASASRLQVQHPTARRVPPLPSSPLFRTTNNLYVKTRHEPITGVYHIDPEIDTVALGKQGTAADDMRLYNRKHRQRHRHHVRRASRKGVELPDPNAIFETKQGAVALDLGIMASPGSSLSRALIQATTKQGSVNINVIGIHAQRYLNMEIATRNGNVHILIPRSFSGYIQLYSRHGNLILLPHLARSMQLVYRRNREMQLVVGHAMESWHEKAAAWTGGTIHVASKHGDIIIGYLGEDAIPAEEKGFWQKLTGIFQH